MTIKYHFIAFLNKIVYLIFMSSNRTDTAEFFNKQGFALVRNFFLKEVTEIKNEIIDYLNFFGKKHNLINERIDDYDQLVKKIMIPGTKLRTFIYDSIMLRPSIQKINHSTKLKQILKDFGYSNPTSVDMGNVRFDIKSKTESRFLRGIHQDVRSIHSKKTVTIWLPITEVNNQRGTVVMYPETHNSGLYKHIYKPNLLIEHDNLPKSLDELEKNKFLIEANPGDVAIFNCFCLHRSEESKIDTVRSVIQFTITDIAAVDVDDGFFFLKNEYEAFARKPEQKDLNSTLS